MSMPLNLSPRTEIDLNNSCNCCIPKKDKHSQEDDIEEKTNSLSDPIISKKDDSVKKKIKDKSYKKIKGEDSPKNLSTHKLELYMERKST